MSNVYHSLAGGNFSQDWTDLGLITVNDDWNGVPSIIGYRGDGLTSATGADPQGVTADDLAPVVDVNANQTNPNTFSTGGVTEFNIANPTIALAGSGTADAPYIVIHLDATGRQSLNLTFNARDLDGSADDALQQVAVQFRIGETGGWTNVPAGFINDATTGPSFATLVTPVSVTLPAAADNQAQVQVRIITTNAAGNDEWVGIDDIVVSSDPAGAPPETLSIAATDANKAEGTLSGGFTDFTFTVTRANPDGEAGADWAITNIGGSGQASADDFEAVSGTVSFIAGEIEKTVTIRVAADAVVEGLETFSVALSNPTGGASIAVATANGTIVNDDVNASEIINGVRVFEAPADGLAGQSGATSTTPPAATNTLNLVRLGAVDSGSGNAGAEAVSYDAASRKAFITNGAANRIDIVDLSDPFHPEKTGEIALGGLPGYGGVNSVAVKNGVVAVAYGNATAGQPGTVALFDLSGTLLRTIDVGVQPDQVVFAGNLLLVANEGEAISASNNAQGSITVIDLSGGAAGASIRNTIGFDALDGNEATLRDRGLILFPGQDASRDIEPEYITVSEDGQRAFVTLQEVNGLAVIDLTDAGADRPVSILPLGFVDNSRAGNELDASDRDGPGGTPSINIETQAVRGALQPDAAKAFTVAGVTYIITANEGDARIGTGLLDEARLGGANTDTARLNVIDFNGSSAGGRDLDGDGIEDAPTAYGGRGFSIFRAEADGTFTKVRESGGEFEKILASQPNASTAFNGQNGGDFDTRSDNKASEPEGVDVISVGGRSYAFISLERAGGVMVYDVTDPANASFVRYVGPTAQDFGPEVIEAISAAESPIGVPLVLTANEISGTLTIYAAQAASAPTLRPIYEIQGAAQQSAFAGQQVTTFGIVTAVASNGYYLQDPSGDGNDATSDGIFVFTGSAGLKPAVGDSVNVVGTVGEFLPGGNANNLTVTQISGSTFTLLSSGNAVAATEIGAAGRLPPQGAIESNPATFDPAVDAIDFFESLEGMLVSITASISVSPTNGFGEIWVASVDSTDVISKNLRDGLTISPGDFNPQRIQIDDDLYRATLGAAPNVNVGTEFGPIIGVVSYNFNNFEVLSLAPPTITQASTIEEEITSLNADPYTLTFANYNVENLDPSDVADGRVARFGEQIVNNLNSPAIIALQEVQDNDGATNSAITDASQSAQVLIDAIIAAGGPAYLYVDVPPIDDTSGGQPGGNIRPGFLYNPALVQYVAGSARVLVDASDVTNAGADDGAFLNSRKPLVAEFIFQGETFTFVNNHFNSKGGDQPLFGANQPPVLNSEVQRIQQAAIVNAFVDGELAGDPDANVIVMGDLNDFSWSNPLTTLDGSFGGGTKVLFDLADELFTSPAERYSYVFDGNSQELDHVYLTKALLDDFRPQFDIVHVNAEFANQASDHDPSVVALSVNDPLTRIVRGDGNDVVYGRTGGDRIIAGAGDDAVDGLPGDDVIDGGAGNDRLRGDHGDDTIFGGAGNDRLIGFTGNDVLYGQQGNDNILGEMGDDYLNGGLGDDFLDSGVGNDVMIGGAGNDTLINPRGSDRMEGGRGNDFLVGAVAESDVFVFRAGDGHDRFRHFYVNDVLELDSRLAADFAAVLARSTQVGADVVISFDAETSITLEAARLSRLQADDFQFV